MGYNYDFWVGFVMPRWWVGQLGQLPSRMVGAPIWRYALVWKTGACGYGLPLYPYG